MGKELERYKNAQKEDYPRALAEVRSGRKRSHWMWYIFPQILGLGKSPTSMRYSIRNAAEAIAYMEDDVLGPRLVEKMRWR